MVHLKIEVIATDQNSGAIDACKKVGQRIQEILSVPVEHNACYAIEASKQQAKSLMRAISVIARNSEYTTITIAWVDSAVGVTHTFVNTSAAPIQYTYAYMDGKENKIQEHIEKVYPVVCSALKDLSSHVPILLVRDIFRRDYRKLGFKSADDASAYITQIMPEISDTIGCFLALNPDFSGGDFLTDTPFIRSKFTGLYIDRNRVRKESRG